MQCWDTCPLSAASIACRKGSDNCLQDCLDTFTEEETLEAEEGYNCAACKRTAVGAKKQLSIYRWPPVLMLHLKRFSANTGSGLLGRFSALSKVGTGCTVVLCWTRHDVSV